jgi:hypothetical protein
MFDEEEITYTCLVCSGPANPMGVLGNYLWLRCRNCGMEQNVQIEGYEFPQPSSESEGDHDND